MDERQRKRNRVPGVFKRGRTWSYKISVQDAGGRYKQVWRGGFATQDAANEARIGEMAKRNSGIDINPERITVEEYLRRWLKEYASQLGDKTHRGYAALFENHVIPVVGNVRLAKLQPLQVQGVYSRMREKGLAEKTVLNCHRALSEALRRAVRWDLIIRNVADSVEPPRPQAYRPVVLSIEYVHALLRLLDETPQHVLIRFALYSGMRQGELLRLRWRDVDFGTSLISIPRAKSRAGERAIALSPDAIDLLQKHRYRQMKLQHELDDIYLDEGFVFARADGAPLSVASVEWSWQKLRKTLGTAARFHDLRHTNASLLLAAGVAMKIVQERLGHASFQVTADTYSHLVPGLELSEKASSRLDALLRPGAVSTAPTLWSTLVARAEDEG